MIHVLRFFGIGLGSLLLLQAKTISLTNVINVPQKAKYEDISLPKILTIKADANIKLQPTLMELQSFNPYSLVQLGLVITKFDFIKLLNLNYSDNSKYIFPYIKLDKEFDKNNQYPFSQVPGLELKLSTFPKTKEPEISLFLNLPKGKVQLLELKQEKFVLLKLKERRVYLYQYGSVVSSYPVAVGKSKWETPTGNFKVMQMLKNPGWTNFKTGKLVDPGKNNPLGERWIAFWTDGKDYIGFHGTPDRTSIGKAASHGCVRMYNEDIRQLYTMVEIGTPVIVDE